MLEDPVAGLEKPEVKQGQTIAPAKLSCASVTGP